MARKATGRPPGRPRKNPMADPDNQQLVREIQQELGIEMSTQEEINDLLPDLPAETIPSNVHSDFIEPMADVGPAPESPTAISYVEVPATKGRRGAAKPPAANPASKTTGQAEINKVLGSAVTFRFSKIDDRGSVVYLNECSIDDLRYVGGDVERFIQENLITMAGDGAFLVEAKNEQGAITKSKRYNVLSPYRPAQGGFAPPAVDNKIVDRLLSKIERAEEAERNRPQVDPFQQLRQMQELMGPKSDPMLLLMMMQQQQQPRGPDPELAMMRMQLEQLKNVPPPMLPPPPPPPAPPTLIEQLVPLIPLIQPLLQRKEQPSFIDQAGQFMGMFGPMIKDMFGGRNEASSEIHRLQLEHLKEKIEDLSTGDSVGLTIDTLRQIKKLNKEIGGGPAESSVKYFFENFQQNMTGLAEAARALRGQDRQPPRLPSPAAPPPAKSSDEPPALPAAFHEIMVKLNSADTDELRLMLMLEALRVLHDQTEYYKPIPQKLMAQVKMGLRDQFKISVEMFMQDIVNNGLLPQEAADRVIAAASAHFDDVRKLLKESEDGEEEEE